MEQLTSIEQYNSIVERYRRPGCLTNDYLQTRAAGLIAHGALLSECWGDNAYLLETKDNCHRLYYYLNDLGANDNLEANGPMVTEILYRSAAQSPDAEVAFLERMGFVRNLVRDQYAAMYKDLTPAGQYDEVIVKPAVDLDEVQWSCRLFNDMFDPYSGDFIPDREFEGLLKNSNILLATDDSGSWVGALHQTVERNVAWISHVAVVPAARGRHVGQALLDDFVERNHVTDRSRYMLWVQQQNIAAVTMYKKKGFIDLGKSTLSLIKRTAD